MAPRVQLCVASLHARPRHVFVCCGVPLTPVGPRENLLPNRAARTRYLHTLFGDTPRCPESEGMIDYHRLYKARLSGFLCSTAWGRINTKRKQFGGADFGPELRPPKREPGTRGNERESCLLPLPADPGRRCIVAGPPRSSPQHNAPQ